MKETVFFRNASVTRISALCVSICIGMTVAAPSFAATPAKEMLPISDAVLVTRGEFLRAALTILDITLPKGKKDLPYTSVPSSMLPYVQAAYDKNALSIFGNEIQLEKNITRGEAVSVLVKLMDVSPTNEKTKKFADVFGKDAEQAAAIAIQKGWVRSQSSRAFGWKRMLTGKDAVLLLQRVVNPASTSSKTIRITIPTNLRAKAVGPVPKEDVMRTVWDLLKNEYLYIEKLDETTAGNRAVDALVKSLDDPYTIYMPPVKAQSFQDQLNGEIEGIGATVELIDGYVMVVSPIKGSPAEKAGLMPKDLILTVDGVSLTGLSLDDAVLKIRGPKGSSVKLHIRREGVELDVTVVRDKVVLPEVEINIQDNVAIVKIHQFGKATDTQLRPKLEETAKQNALRGVIIDLRNNPGGYLHAAEEVVSNFLPKGTIFASIAARDGTTQEITHEEPTVHPSVKVVVLVNNGSASASEIVAGALQDTKRATIIGEKTYGKGTVQQIIQFTDGSSLKMTIAEWMTPNGRKINKLGVEPDEVIATVPGDRDEPMLRAMNLLR
jgi:C-terminal peptidase prc